jgi:tRNA threonylcarbamoyladenosine biosynthesis protein TsaB
VISLAIDASTYRGTVAVVRDGRLVAEGEAAMRGATDERLMPAVVDALAAAGVGAGQLDRVICGGGPGSFTSLRIAAGIAKGLVSALGIPLFAVPSLGLVVGSTRRAAGSYCVTMDALRGDSYVAMYEVDRDGAVDERQPARVLPSHQASKLASEQRATLLAVAAPGEAAAVWPHARGVLAFAEWIDARGCVDASTWEPAYGRLAEAQVKWEAAHGRSLAGA